MDWAKFLEITVNAFPMTAIIGGCATFLGRVWGARIARNEQHALQLKLEKEIGLLRNKLDLQKEMLLQAQDAASTDHAAITIKQIESVNEYWRHWLDFKKELAKFHTPHTTLTVEELNQTEILQSRMFSFTPDQVHSSFMSALETAQKIEKLRPMLTTQIYQHHKGLTKLYTRIALRFSLSFPDKTIVAWYQTDPGKTDPVVKSLQQYGKAIGLALPNPENRPDTYSTFTEWQNLLEEKLSELIYEFVNGSLDRQMRIHEAIQQLSQEADPK